MTQTQTPARPPAREEHGQVKETLISVVIAFVMAFVFRAFVIEAFIIPTGSMAPTLMGQHVRIQSEQTGYTWPVGPQQMSGATPLAVQSDVVVHDPMTGQEIYRRDLRTRAGDRILVFKYLYSIYDPRRFDVVVFKAPHFPQENYIKRLVGLPGEMIALIDGDVFVRRPPAGEALPAGTNPWLLPGWQIQRKEPRIQRAVWQDVFSSEYEPLTPIRDALGRPYRSPWLGGAGWSIDGRRSYEYSGPGPTRLVWDNVERDAQGRVRWPITDYTWYNDTQSAPGTVARSEAFSVSDVNMRCGIEPKAGAVDAAAVVRTRLHEFRGEIRGTAVTLRMGALGEPGADGEAAAPTAWQTLATGTLERPLEPGRVTNVEFWHVDQGLELWVDGRLIAAGVYEWTPAERLERALGVTPQQVIEAFPNNPLANNTNYPQPRLWWEFDGGPLTLHRVGLQRDIHYQAGRRPTDGGTPPRATHPMTTMTLGRDHFFVCGDNSAQSLDSRLWSAPDGWVAAEIDGTEGIVPRDLMIGRAFFVYFPSLIRGSQSGLPVPDFGRMRWIW